MMTSCCKHRSVRSREESAKDGRGVTVDLCEGRNHYAYADQVARELQFQGSEREDYRIFHFYYRQSYP
jgi:hypothetical protein